MKTTRLISVMLCAAFLAFFTGCEGDSKDSGGGGYGEEAVVVSIGEAPAGSGGIKMLGTEEWNVIVTADAQIQKQRESCSGYDNVSVNSIKHGDILEFDVRKDHTTYYPGKPTTTPSWIKASRPECRNVPSDDKPDCYCISTNCP